MTDYELDKLARKQALYLKEAMKADDLLLDLIYPPRYMNIEEAADFLRMPVNTVYSKKDEIPHVKIGKRLIFKDRALVRYVERIGRTEAVEVKIETKLRKTM